MLCKAALLLGLLAPVMVPATVNAADDAPTSISAPVTIVALGDSLSAGYMLPPGAGFPEQLEARLKAAGDNAIVINAGVSGDTSAGGLARLGWAVGPDADAVILELGSNDALRGIDPEITRTNLDTIIRELKARQIDVLLAGMLAPPNMGTEYGEEFNRIYPDLARAHDLVLYPFFLDGVAANPALNLPDGIHPTAEGIGIIVERIAPDVRRLIGRVEARRAATAATN